MIYENRARIGACLYNALLFEEVEALYPDYLSMLAAYQWCVNANTILPVEYYKKICRLNTSVEHLLKQITNEIDQARMILMADHPVMMSICAVEVDQWIVRYSRDVISGENVVERIISNKQYLDWNARHSLYDFVRASYFMFYVRSIAMIVKHMLTNLEMLYFKNRFDPYVSCRVSSLNPQTYDRKIFKDNNKEIDMLTITSVQARESFYVGPMKEFYEELSAYGYDTIVFTDENGKKHTVHMPL